MTAVLPVSPIPTVTSLTNIAPTAALPPIPAASVPPVNPTPIAVQRRFPATTDVPRPTPVVSASLVLAIPIVTYPTSLVTVDVLPQTPAVSAPPASPVRRKTLVPAFPAGLTPTAPEALATVTQGIPVMPTPGVLK